MCIYNLVYMRLLCQYWSASSPLYVYIFTIVVYTCIYIFIVSLCAYVFMYLFILYMHITGVYVRLRLWMYARTVEWVSVIGCLFIYVQMCVYMYFCHHCVCLCLRTCIYIHTFIMCMSMLVCNNASCNNVRTVIMCAVTSDMRG